MEFELGRPRTFMTFELHLFLELGKGVRIAYRELKEDRLPQSPPAQ